MTVLLASVVGAAGGDTVSELGPAVIMLRLPQELGTLQRPPVQFDHGAHAEALADDGCQTCHTVDEDQLTPRYAPVADLEGRNALLDGYHEACMDCHTERTSAGLASGPVTCGECHVRQRGEVVHDRAEMTFDYSLHGRHAQAYPEDCGACHHVLDEGTDTLVYREGTEDACGACHFTAAVDGVPSEQVAAHTDCVGCHLSRQAAQAVAGPVRCVGCHDAERQAAYAQLVPVPRLERGQPDRTWVHAEGARSDLVPFDHLGHEPQASSCSGCHHQSLEPCASCHTLTGAPEGDGVTLERAYHQAGSMHSCVGCHLEAAAADECAGCHAALTATPSERACVVCHRGPAAAEVAEEELPPVEWSEAIVPPLPPATDALPETVMIDQLADEYEGSNLPHYKIVRRLDEIARNSALATRFHGSVETLCAGCHHHTPVGERPPRCASCHGATAADTVDRPDLKTAYHRQCIGCHQEMQIAEQGCTDCHAQRALGEDQS
jgi:hypothetical protein